MLKDVFRDYNTNNVGKLNVTRFLDQKGNQNVAKQIINEFKNSFVETKTTIIMLHQWLRSNSP